MTKYTSSFTPAYSQSNIPFQRYAELRDNQGLIRELVLILFPNTAVIPIHREDENGLLQGVKVESYSNKLVYVDPRLLTETPPNTNTENGMNRDKMLQWLESCEGTRYLWGGNYRDGLESTMKNLYPNAFEAELDLTDFSNLCCCGLDCSGLLYQASEGFTPRDTSQLVSFGTEVPIKDPFCVKELMDKVEPLDILVWEGHVLIVLSKDYLIESSLNKGGVIISPLEIRYLELRQAHKPLLRRWFNVCGSPKV